MQAWETGGGLSDEGPSEGHRIVKNTFRGNAEGLISSSASFFMNSASCQVEKCKARKRDLVSTRQTFQTLLSALLLCPVTRTFVLSS